MSANAAQRADLGKVIERQMRNWELARLQRARQATPDHSPRAAAFVAISRSVGSGGSEVARLLGERLGWPVFDREILQAMAGDNAVRQHIYEHMDEHDRTWLDSALRWILQGDVRKDDYFYRLTETLLALHRQGHAIFLGRASDLILSASEGLRVRIVAPQQRRAEQHALRNNLPLNTACAEIERIDSERAEFRRRHFGRNACDETAYDLVLNLESFTPEHAVDLIVAALRLRKLLL